MKRPYLFILPVVAVVMLIGCFFLVRSLKNAEPEDVPVLRIASLDEPSSAPVLIGIGEGLFIAEGVDVEIVHFKDETARDNFLKSGAADGAIVDIVEVDSLQGEGLFVKAVSVVNEENRNAENEEHKLRQRLFAFTGESLEEKREEIIKFQRIYNSILLALQEKGKYDHYLQDMDFNLVLLGAPAKEEVEGLDELLKKEKPCNQVFLFDKLFEREYFNY